MQTNKLKLKWWILFLPLGLVLGLFVLEAGANLTGAGHRAVETGLVLLLYGIVWLWLNANEWALLNKEREKTRQELRRAVEPLRQPYDKKGQPEVWRNGNHSGKKPSSSKRESAWIHPVIYDRGTLKERFQ
jgi:hypothetical protein